MWRRLAWAEDVLACAALVVFTVAIFVGVICRYILNYPLSWTDEMSLIAFAWLMFFGAAVCARENSHILIDLLMPKPGTSVHRLSEAFAALVATIVSLVMAWISYRYMVGAAPMVTPVFRLSSVVYNAAAPLGFTVIALHMGRLFILALAGRDLAAHQEEGI